MSYSTASALIDAVRLEVDNSAASDTTMLNLLNDEFMRVQREHDFSFQEQFATRSMATAASGFSRFVQPTDAKELLHMYYIESSERKELDYLSHYDALTSFPDPSEAKTPQAWSLFRDEVWVFPSLNSAVTAELYYIRFLPEFTATASNDFLTWTPDVLRYGLLKAYSAWHGEQNAAGYYQGLLADAVTSALRYHKATKNTPQQSTIPRTPGTMLTTQSGGRLRSYRSSRW